MPRKTIQNNQRFVITAAVAVSVTYSLVVIWYVATFPDVGVRALLPMEGNEHRLLISHFDHAEEDCRATPVKAGQRLELLRRQPAGNFLLYSQALAGLRNAPLPPQGALAPNADPSERADTPPLVEIPATEDKAGEPPKRMVELILRQPGSGSEPGTSVRTYVTVKAMRPGTFLPTIAWFLCQLAILVVAMTVLWQRPGDPVVRLFCLMSSVAMPAFVGGFHWWILVANPYLNLPFIVCACLLPAVTLHFFCRFPRENILLQGSSVWRTLLLYAPAATSALLVGLTYWAAYLLSGNSSQQNELSEFQKLVAVTASLFQNEGLTFDGMCVGAQLLYVLRLLVYTAIIVSSVYFALTVASLFMSLLRTQNPVERRQASGILVASMVSTIPILYTLYLAFFQKADFALGKAKIPMLVASSLFMAAYAHGMLRHRLILADEVWASRRRYLLASGMVTSICAFILAVGAVATRVHGLPTGSSIPVQVALFIVLVVAIGFVLWARDRIQSAVDQRFFSEKYVVNETLKQLNEASGYLADPSALANITILTCRDVLDASDVSLFVREGSGNFRLIGTVENGNVPTAIPASRISGAEELATIVRRPSLIRVEVPDPVHQLLEELSGELICFLGGEGGVEGFILLARKTSGANYTAEDISFLQAIGQMTGLALHSSRANQNLTRLSSELEAKVDHIAEQQRQLSMLRAELTALQDNPEQRDQEATPGVDRGEIRGNSGPMREILQTVGKAAPSTSTILIRGESGTGKELLARVVHRNSDRAEKALVSVNCAALAPSLLESELFGHVRGAFTGANSDKEGRFQAADGGTLFLDEIGDISLETQVKLLRVLQERCFEPVGTTSTVNVDVRLIAATNRNLEAMIAEGQFREDLYYRLNVVDITLPPLRDRRDDLIELVFHFLNRSVKKTDKRIRQIEPEALSAIERYSWPGNIRELENAIERAVVLADGDTITVRDFPEDIRAVGKTADTKATIAEQKKPYIEIPTVTVSEPQKIENSVADFERAQILSALEKASGNKTKAARSLNMPRSTFYSKLKKIEQTDNLR